MKITHIHSGLNALNGSLYFLVDGRLLSISVVTPNFNDYNEFRFRDLSLSNNKYKPEENEVDLKPYIIEPFEINEEELAYLDRWFAINNMIDEDDECLDSPYHYLDSENLLTSINFKDGYKHLIYKPSDWFEKSNQFLSSNDKWKLFPEINNEPKLHESGGMQRLLVHISEAVFKNFYGKA